MTVTLIKAEPLFRMRNLRPREDGRSQHAPEAGGVGVTVVGHGLFRLHPASTRDWASLGSRKEDARTKGTEGEAQA